MLANSTCICELWRQSLHFANIHNLAAVIMVKEDSVKTEKVLKCKLSFSQSVTRLVLFHPS